MFNFVKHSFGTFSASTNWLTRADAYYSKTSLYAEKHLDYVATWTHHLQPIKPAFMSILKLKANESWYWFYLDGWWHLHKGISKHDGYYNDVSDHYPVVATFEFPVHYCNFQDMDNSIQSAVTAGHTKKFQVLSLVFCVFGLEPFITGIIKGFSIFFDLGPIPNF